jgi:hypothetical protein
LREPARRYTQDLGAADDTTVSSRVGLARALRSLGRFQEAESELLEVESAMRQAARGGDPYRYTVEVLVNVYEKWDRADPQGGHGTSAQVWRDRLQTIRSQR